MKDISTSKTFVRVNATAILVTATCALIKAGISCWKAWFGNDQQASPATTTTENENK